MLAALERRVYPDECRDDVARATVFFLFGVGSDRAVFSAKDEEKSSFLKLNFCVKSQYPWKKLGTLNLEMFEFKTRFLNIELKSSIFSR